MYSTSAFFLSISSSAISTDKEFVLLNSIYSFQGGIMLSNNCGGENNTHLILDALILSSNDLQCVSKVQNKKNDYLSLVLLSRVDHVIQMEIIRCQCKETASQ